MDAPGEIYLIDNKEFNLAEFVDTDETKRYIRYTYYSDNKDTLELYDITFGLGEKRWADAQGWHDIN